MCGAANTAFMRKFVALGAYIRKEEWSKINIPSFYSKKLEKNNKVKSNRRKKVIKIKAETNKIETDMHREN